MDEHPLKHIPKDTRYQWYLDQCSELNAARAARQDGLISTITQISAAAVLAVPGFVLASDSEIAAFAAAPLLYVGIIGFGIALLSAMAEQHFSAKAHERHLVVIEKYLFLESSEREDMPSRALVKFARRVTYVTFILALTCSALGLLAA